MNSASLNVIRPKEPSGFTLFASVGGRLKSINRWKAWARSERQLPCILFHGASVGELKALATLIELVKQGLPGYHYVASYASASAARYPFDLGLDHMDFLPLGGHRELQDWAGMIDLRAMVVARGDLWPTVAQAVVGAGCPLVVAGGSISENSRRLSFPGRALLRPTFERLSWVGTTTEADRERFVHIGAPEAACETIGDPRHDAVRPVSTVDVPEGDVLLCGSTHPEDEVMLLEAFAGDSRRDHRSLVLVPHNPGPAAADRIRDVANRSGVKLNEGAEARFEPGVCTLVNQLGQLSELYGRCRIAYVGGGLTGRLHSVIEPAAHGRPVIVGPRIAGDRDARELLKSRGAFALPSKHPGKALGQLWEKLSNDEDWRSAAEAALGSVVPGASQVVFEKLSQLLANRE